MQEEYPYLQLQSYSIYYLFLTVYSSQAKSHACLESLVDEIKQKCGQVCDTDLESDIEGKYYNQLWKNIDCDAMFKHSIFDRLTMFSKPIHQHELPKSVKNEFIYKERIKMQPLYGDSSKCMSNTITITSMYL